jgi:NitT/TauT family transport system substrate-binding protein
MPRKAPPACAPRSNPAHVDAAVLWDPDLALALRNVKGAHVVYSTKTATNLIFDVMVCDSRLLAKPEGSGGGPEVRRRLDGRRPKVARANPDNAVEALVKTEEFFKLLADKEGRPFVKSLFANLVWTGVEDNARILGLAGGTNHYERVYKRFDEIYRKAGALANPKSPVIAPQDSFDYRFIKAMLARTRRRRRPPPAADHLHPGVAQGSDAEGSHSDQAGDRRFCLRAVPN